MTAWIETVGVVAVSVLGLGLGLRCARAGLRVWWAGYLGALAFFALCAAATLWHRLEFHPPLSLLPGGRGLAVLKALAGMFLLAALVPRLPLARDRRAVGVAFGLVVAKVSVWPFLAPAFNQEVLARLVTHFDADGICRQSTPYTCGPAAAATALRRLGLAADEGDLAVRCHTSEALGTPPRILCDVLARRYGEAGLTCEYRWFPAIGDLPAGVPTLVLVRFGWLLDHYVVLIEQDGGGVVVADPLFGKRVLTLAEFDALWRHVGIVLRRSAGGPPGDPR